jgi:poly-gamma-glutamate synthase PgsB/CapB
MPELHLLALLLPAAATLLFLLVRAVRLRAALKSVPLRIHVGGTRGKSSVCRMVAAALRASGIRTVAKTTGTAPLLILPDGRVEPWRRFGPASIGEQRRFALVASRLQARATVLECMAIRPELIAASERDLVRATIAVITNIRPDHLEDTPSTAEITEGFLGLVPQNGVIVVGEDADSPALRDRAANRGTALVAVKTSGLSPDAANQAMARAVCEAAGIAFTASESAGSDPGAFSITELAVHGKHLRFANAFACNDVASLDLLWKRHAQTPHAAVALLNHRNDRPLRSLQFLDYFAALPRRPRVLLLGSTFWLRRAARRRGLDFSTVPARPWLAGRTMLERIAERVPEGSFVWGVGNYYGRGEAILQALAQK